MLKFFSMVTCTSWCVEGKAVSMDAGNVQWDSFEGKRLLAGYWEIKILLGVNTHVTIKYRVWNIS